MDKTPKFNCSECGEKLDGPGHIFPEREYSQIGWGDVNSSKRLCDECNKIFLGETLNQLDDKKEKDKVGDVRKATESQKSYLKHLGYKENIEGLTISKASELIRELLKK